MFPGLDLPYKTDYAQPLTMAREELDDLSVDRCIIYLSECAKLPPTRRVESVAFVDSSLLPLIRENGLQTLLCTVLL